MSLNPVWGFDPDEAFKAQRLFRERFGANESAYNPLEEQVAQIPPDVRSQIDELYRICEL